MTAINDPLKPGNVITSPDKQHFTNNREFQCGPGIEITEQGRLWASWYSGGEDEGADNFVLLVSSSDGGTHWSEPITVVDTPGKVRASDPSIWIDPVGRLWFFWTQNCSQGYRQIFDGRNGVWGMYTEDPEKDSPVWSEPVRFAEGVMLNKPTVVSNGEWIFPTALWPDNFGRGTIEDAFKPFSGANLTVSTDQGKTFEYRGGVDIPGRWYDEHMFVEKRDGRIWSLIRAQFGIGQSYSTDGGVTWSEGSDTMWGGPNSRFFIRRLQSGKLLLVNHQIDETKYVEGYPMRCMLTAYLSDDDGDNWYGGLMLDGRDNVSYPDGVQDKDGTIWIIYDHERYKRGDILFARFTEEDVIAAKCASSIACLKTLINSSGGVKAEGKRNQTNVMD